MRQGWTSLSIPGNKVSDFNAWANENTITVGFIADPVDGLFKCETVVKHAVELWYGSDRETALKDFGYTHRDTSTVCSGSTSYDQTCETTNADKWSRSTDNATALKNFQSGVKSKIYAGKTPELDAAALYLRAQAHIELPNTCAATPFKKVSDLTAEEKKLYPGDTNTVTTTSGSTSNSTTVTQKNYLIVKLVNGETWKAENWVYKIDKSRWSKQIQYYEKMEGGSIVLPCYFIANQMTDYSNAIAKDAASMIAANQDPSDKYGSIIKTPGTAANDVPGALSTDVEAGGTSCAIDGVGWIVCPLVSFMASIADGSFTFLADNFLQVKTDIVANDGPTFSAWVVVRNIANVAFVIAFLFIIFSQLTGQGVTNYGIKKMLPRLVVAAILVNISFYICQLAVDISNILGFSLKNALEGISGQVANTTPQGVDQSGNWVGIVGLVLAGTGIAWGLGISVLLPFLLAAVVALIMVFIILVVREMLIILLIVLAPLAFVAFLLPNTEKFFTQWRKIFVALLLIFPIVGLLFGASTLASNILTSAYGGSENIIGQIIAKAILVVPLLLLPTILKGSLNAVPAIGNLASKLSGKANAGVTGKAREAYKNSLFGRGRAVRRAAKEEFRNRRYAERLNQNGVVGSAARLSARGTSALGIGKEARAQRDSIVNNAEAIVANAEAKEVADAQKVLVQQMGMARAQQGATFDQDAYLHGAATGTGVHTGNTQIQRSAAMQQLAAAGRDGVIRKLQTQFRTTNDGTAQANLQRAIQANGGALVGKAPDIVKGAGPAFGTTKGKDLSGFTAGTAAVHMEHLQNLFAAATSPSATAKEKEALDTAVSAFNSAVEDIVSNPSLQAEFGPDVGKKYKESYENSSPAFKAYADSNLSGIAGIQSDGKIR